MRALQCWPAFMHDEEKEGNNMRIVVCFLLTLFITGCSDPIVMIPGGKLKGEITPVPESWSSVPDVVQLEVQPSDPYSLNIWAVVAAGKLHVATRAAKWVPMLAEDSNVRVRIDGKLYELTARKLTTVGDLEIAAKAYLEKYDLDEPLDTETAVYALTARR